MIKDTFNIIVVVQGLGDRKKKHAADKKKFEEELEELRSQQEVNHKVSLGLLQCCSESTS